ncbi:MAG: hypothetical protein KatS3mg131_0698 [Candidatus Tectimicrobiota bacterium]|nr:MAG: hypothetical protein KatS3mg131_0698 [Candidatus Tectomicrobia bacterium]
MQADRHLLVEAEAVCVEAVRQASAVLMEYFRTPLAVEFKEKGQQAPVTEADRHAEALLRRALTRAFPSHGIVAEEDETAVNAAADYLWFLDPLDGTANFAAGLPAFAVSAGLCYRGTPVLGVIAIPGEGAAGTLLRAHWGGGAYCNDRRIHVAAEDVPAGTQLVSMPFWFLRQYRLRHGAQVWRWNVRAHGSIAYELGYTACGALQLAIISGARLWDMVAGVVLVHEAGGMAVFGNARVRRWCAWEAFVQRALDGPFGQNPAALRALRVHLLAGNPRLVQQRAQQIRLRMTPWLLRQVRRRWRQLRPRRTQAADA